MGNIFSGYREGAQDWTVQYFDVANDLTPSGTGAAVLNYGVNIINFSGTRNVAVLPSGIESSTKFIYVKNLSDAGNWVVSGTTSGQLIDGATTKAVGAQNAFLHLFNASGAGYITL